MYIAIGLIVGAINGLFGAFGGMILVPLLMKFAKIEEKQAFATSVSIILPLSIMSCIIYIYQGSFDFDLASPFLIGGFLGGLLSGRCFKKIPVIWLKRFLGAVIIYGGVRSILLL